MEVRRRGVAWEHGEFLPGWWCAAVPVRVADVALLGSVAVSAQPERFTGREQQIEGRLRQVAGSVAFSAAPPTDRSACTIKVGSLLTK